MHLLLVILLVVLIVGALPTWPYSADWGPFPAGGLSTILVVLIILLFLGRL